MEAHSEFSPLQLYDRVSRPCVGKPTAGQRLREAILAFRNGGIVSMIDVYGGLMDKFPIGSLMNRSITVRTGQCHVQRYTKPLLNRF